jgi:hypothetical protein
MRLTPTVRENSSSRERTSGERLTPSGVTCRAADSSMRGSGRARRVRHGAHHRAKVNYVKALIGCGTLALVGIGVSTNGRWRNKWPSRWSNTGHRHVQCSASRDPDAGLALRGKRAAPSLLEISMAHTHEFDCRVCGAHLDSQKELDEHTQKEHAQQASSSSIGGAPNLNKPVGRNVSST